MNWAQTLHLPNQIPVIYFNVVCKFQEKLHGIKPDTYLTANRVRYNVLGSATEAAGKLNHNIIHDLS